MNRFEAVIFDMDGVLIDSEPLHFAVLSELLERAGHPLTRADARGDPGHDPEDAREAGCHRHGPVRERAVEPDRRDEEGELADDDRADQGGEGGPEHDGHRTLPTGR